jgi:hypothetical protein
VGNTSRLASMARERPRPMDRETVRKALVEPVSEGDTARGTASNLTPQIVLIGWRRGLRGRSGRSRLASSQTGHIRLRVG